MFSTKAWERAALVNTPILDAYYSYLYISVLFILILLVIKLGMAYSVTIISFLKTINFASLSRNFTLTGEQPD